MTSFNSKAKGARIAVALLLIATVLVSTGCPPGSPVPMGVPPPPHPWFERPAITTDGAGGVIVFYAYQEGLDRWLWHRHWCRWRGFYVQRLDNEGNPQWKVAVGRGYSRGPEALEIISDQARGAILVWRAAAERRGEVEALTTHIARLNCQGEILWEQEFLEWEREEFADKKGPIIPRPRRFAVTSDGLGGVIIIWYYRPDHLTIQRIDSEGQFLWGEDGIEIPLTRPLPRAPRGERSLDAAVTEKGNVILVWEEEDGRIFAQVISPQGEALWQEEVRVGMGRWPEVTPDRLGGAIIAWKQPHQQQDDHPRRWQVIAQRIDPQGNLLWQEEGIPVFGFTTKRWLAAWHRVGILNLINSRPGETIVSLAILRDRYTGLYAQKIDYKGNVLWQEGGLRISAGRIDHSSIAGDNFGGAILMWARQVSRDGRLLQAQRLDSAGKPLWPERGAAVTTAPGGRFSVAPDGEGGVFVAWVAHEYGPLLSYVQRISAEGEPMWGDEGIMLYR